MSSYLNHNPRSNLIIQHSFNLVFRKIETIFFIFLSVICLITSKINHDFSNKISNVFITISTPIVKIVSFPINGSIDLIVNFNKLALAKKENLKLREELFKLQNYYLTSLAIHQENKELRSALNFVKSKTENYKVARIIGMSHQAFDQKLLIHLIPLDNDFNPEELTQLQVKYQKENILLIQLSANMQLITRTILQTG